MQPLDKPKAKLEKARSDIESMRKAQDFDSFEEAWHRFLHRLERVWNKTSYHLSRSPKYQGRTVRGRTEKLRKKDILLSHLINARGADGHTIEEITGRKPSEIRVNSAVGSALYIKQMSINKGNMFIESDRPIRVEFIPGRVELLPVTNRGRIYDPPRSHLGNRLLSIEPVVIAELGFIFYEDYIKQAEKFFVK
jgi:hypothetical protein